MARYALALALLLFPTLAAAQPPARVEALGWMSGSWLHEGVDGKVAESWLGPANGVMVAANLTSGANGRTSHEFLRIAETLPGFSYFASPGGRAPVEFALKELSAQRVVFENPAHDFPQRILYWRDGDTLVARIEGTLRGAPRHKEWRFTRQ
jgi:hypothetical protein